MSKLFKFKRDKDFEYIGKFSIGEGNKAQFNIRAGFSSPLEGDHYNQMYNIYYVIVGDRQWPEFLETDSCSRRLGLGREIQSLLIKGDGYWSTYAIHNFNNEYRAQVFYVAAIECENKFHRTDSWMPKIWMEFKAFNAGEHFSQEDWGLLSLNYIMFAVFVIFLGYSSYGYLREIKKEGTWESPMGILVIALLFEFFQILLNLIHYSVYEFDGEGVPTMALLSTICQTISQVFIVTLLMLIAFGWTLTYPHLPEKESIFLFTAMALIIHMLVAGLTYLDKDEYHKFHDYSGVQGSVLVILRLILFGIFMYGINLSRSDIKKKQEGFLRLLTISGSVYILAFPILYVISYVIDPYVRNRFIIFGHFLLQAIAWALLLFQLNAKSSGYKDAKVKTIIGM